jgi:hypothetical protein
MSQGLTITPGKLRVVCVADTRGNDITHAIPDGDLFIHVGDLSLHGTYKEINDAVEWIRYLPHQTKIIMPGKHWYTKLIGVFTLSGIGERDRPAISDESPVLDDDITPLATYLKIDPALQKDGIAFVDELTPRAYFRNRLLIYANPQVPKLKTSALATSHTYEPYPDAEANLAWSSAPDHSYTKVIPLEIWLSNGPPSGHLDVEVDPESGGDINIGCEEQRRQIVTQKPIACIFGRCHASYGVKQVKWNGASDPRGGDGVAESTILTATHHDGDGSVYDLTKVVPNEETVFVNASIFPSELGRSDEKPNEPIVLEFKIGTSRR